MTDLPRDGRERVTWPLTNVPAGVPVEIQFTHAELTPEWHPMTRDTDTEASILLAGPDVDAGAAVALPAGRSLTRVRFTAGDEIVIREGGAVDVG